MLECSHCAQKFIPTEGELNICPHCGHANGAGILHLSAEEDLSEEDRFSDHSLIRMMGRLSLLILLLGAVALLTYGYLSVPEQQEEIPL